MKTKTLGWLVGLGAIACSFMSCSQAKIDCQVALSGSGYNFAATYTVKGEAPACAANLLQTGDVIGMEYYHPPNADQSGYDYTKTTLAVKSQTIQDWINFYGDIGAGDADEMHKPYGYGDFQSTTPDAKDMCPVINIAAGQQDFPEVEDTAGAVDPATDCTMDEDCQIPADPEDPESMPDPASGAICDTMTSKCVAGCRGTGANSCVGPFACSSADDTVGKCLVPAKSIKYEWSNLDVYVTAAAQGTQFSGDLKYTEDGCTIEYHVVGMWPAIDCSGKDADGKPVADAVLCDPCADPANGRVFGSGISPDFPTECKQLVDGAFYCVLPGQDLPQTQASKECPE